MTNRSLKMKVFNFLSQMYRIDDEDNDPYTSSTIFTEPVGLLVSRDIPVLFMPADGIQAENYEIQLLANFREFARLNLGDGDAGAWYKISDNVDWHLLLKVKADSDFKWTDDGSSGGAGHK